MWWFVVHRGLQCFSNGTWINKNRRAATVDFAECIGGEAEEIAVDITEATVTATDNV